MTTLLTWKGGMSGEGSAAIARLEGDAIDVHASSPSAPGSRPTLLLPAGEVVRMKVHRCRAVTTGAPPAPDASLGFFLEGRLIDHTRAARAAIEALL